MGNELGLFQFEIYLDSHGIDIELLVQIVQQSNSLNHHGIDFLGGELQLEPYISYEGQTQPEQREACLDNE